MDGTLAAIFLIASLTDMNLNDCDSGCLQQKDQQARLVLQGAAVEFQDEIIGQEIYLGYEFGKADGPFQPIIGASMTDTHDIWLGMGAKWTSKDIFDGPIFASATLMPGYYQQGDGPDLGGNLQFRASLGLGYAFDNGMTATVAYDHRSNADTQRLNPGLETISLQIAFPFD